MLSQRSRHRYLEVTGEIQDFVAIVTDKYHEIASEFP